VNFATLSTSAIPLEGRTNMGIETAFLLGVLVGHWLLLLALWRASLKVLKILAYMERDFDKEPATGTELYISPILMILTVIGNTWEGVQIWS
jgi:hypothetical protein